MARKTKLTPAARLALAYVHLVGHMPKHIHSSTYCAVLRCCDTNPTMPFGRYLIVKDEFVAEAERHPLCRAAAVLQAKGFTVRQHYSQLGTTHSVALMSRDFVEAHAFRRGSWSIDYGAGGRGQIDRPFAEAA